MNELRKRSAKEVLEDHLRLSQSGTVDEDLARNFSEDLVILCARGIFRGHAGLQKVNQFLQEELANAKFEYCTVLAAEEMAFLEWTAEAENTRVKDGTDSYLIRDGRVVAQTIHYTVILL